MWSKPQATANRRLSCLPMESVMSDVVMPNLDGPSMAQQLRENYGEIRLLFMSGYAEEQLRETISLDNVSFLAKPFSVQQIAEAVYDELAKDG
jgi:two-component system, cell cycle sensor histidine kinase and response regulator CckA